MVCPASLRGEGERQSNTISLPKRKENYEARKERAYVVYGNRTQQVTKGGTEEGRKEERNECAICRTHI